MSPAFTLPRSFDPLEFLPHRLLTYCDDARWLVTQILVKMANRNTDERGYVRLDSQIIRRVLNKDTAVEIVRALERGGAIETAAHYTGVKCRGYRLANRYGSDRAVRRPINDPRLLDRLEREQDRLDAQERKAHRLPIHDRLNDEQRRLTIGPDADLIVDAMPDDARLCQDVLVSRIRRREFNLSVGATSRVFNNITGLSRKLRPALRIGGEPLGSVDIKCCQPGLLAIILERATPPSCTKTPAKYKQPGSLPLPLSLPSLVPASGCLPSSDCSFFCDLAFSGTLYERLIALSGLDRDVVKKRFLTDCIAKKGRYLSEVERVFRLEFPSVYRAIKFINRDDHGNLIRLLQRMESWLVIEQVCPRLVGWVPTVSLHDAIYTTAGSLPTVEAAFNEAFDAIGCRLALKREGG